MSSPLVPGRGGVPAKGWAGISLSPRSISMQLLGLLSVSVQHLHKQLSVTDAVTWQLRLQGDTEREPRLGGTAACPVGQSSHRIHQTRGRGTNKPPDPLLAYHQPSLSTHHPGVPGEERVFVFGQRFKHQMKEVRVKARGQGLRVFLWIQSSVSSESSPAAQLPWGEPAPPRLIGSSRPKGFPSGWVCFDLLAWPFKPQNQPN